eukprot:TRINITY_DN8526_c0_g1_i4.p1 TRINITY_DN8526_c0_g1~~TRINITY_DN8526_c0_g1_i4.p1  ORF type:complete len:202 (-),score=13.77 TRINITY_DN8526_c0_g1_i4:863-1402(-)
MSSAQFVNRHVLGSNGKGEQYRNSVRNSALSQVRSIQNGSDVINNGKVSQRFNQLGVVIVDHGSRKAESNLMLKDFVELYKRQTGVGVVEPAHMEIAEPTIIQAIEKCVQMGVKKVIVAPYFLSIGRHIQIVIPALVKVARNQFQEIEIQIAQPIGIDPLMVDLIHSRVTACIYEDALV